MATRSTRPSNGLAYPNWEAQRVTKLDGCVLPYPLSDRQFHMVLQLALEDGRAPLDVAMELAGRFHMVDIQAEQLLLWAESGSMIGERCIADSLESGKVDHFVLLALMDMVADKAVHRRQMKALQTRYGTVQAAREWVQDQWHRRLAGQFRTRDAFVEWCVKHCPHTIETDHVRVRDKWTPKGRAPLSGTKEGTK
jgi:hypothetical protein